MGMPFNLPNPSCGKESKVKLGQHKRDDGLTIRSIAPKFELPQFRNLFAMRRHQKWRRGQNDLDLR